jgi:ubiquinone/menaquinone biosynthesis C-methylase UbiE
MNSQPHWQFVGSVPENYERYLVPNIFRPWAEDLVEIAALRPGERVLDIACETGIVARTAARKLGGSGSVVGLDLSAPMLAAARAAAAAESVAVEWWEGSAVNLPLGDAAFEVVFCQQGLQFFPDRVSALREIYRVLTPGGRLVLRYGVRWSEAWALPFWQKP